jgi:hypothetical protein
MVTKLLGPAYKTVKLVADNLAALLAIADKQDELIEAADGLEEVGPQAAAATAAATSATASETAAELAQAAAEAAEAAAVAASNGMAAIAAAAAASAAAAEAAALEAENIAGGNFVDSTGDHATYLTVDNDAYDPDWAGNLQVPTKDAVFDKFTALEALRGAANGYAPTGADNKIPVAYLPDAVLGALKYQSTWNADTNTPAIPAAAAGNQGHYYVVSTAGATAIDGVNEWAVGDWIISNGVTWQKVDNTDKVSTVNGYSGTVVLAKADIGLALADNTPDTGKPVSTAQQAALDLKANKTPDAQAAGANVIVPTFNDDIVTRTVTGAVTISNATGDARPNHGFVIRLKDNGTARAIGFGTKYRAMGVTLPTTTVVGKYLIIGVLYNADDDKFDVVSVIKEA